MDIHIITGHLGSGKTEVAVNFAIQLVRQVQQSNDPPTVALIDVDVVNPYFAAREARGILESLGIQVAAPSLKTTTAGLPVLSSQIYQFLHDEDQMVIIDVGGDPVGAKILSSLHEHLQGKNLQMYCVVNTKRPSTSVYQGILSYIRDINAASRLRITGLIHNTHLMDETSVQDIYQGQHILDQVSQEVGLPIVFTAAMKNIAQDIQDIGNEVLPMERYIKPPYLL
jgi:hypothetical protein